MPSRSLKIIICTVPLRPVPTDYPPLGSMAVIQSLRGAGYEPRFYDIDVKRPSFEEVEAYFRREQPDVLGISAVVSTAYSYTKRLAQMARRVCPKARIVVGGNLAASAEILHRLAGVDYCVSGEGEIVSVNLMNYIESRVERGLAGDDYAALRRVRGITFVDPEGHLVFTGQELQIPGPELFTPDYCLLENESCIENFITDPMTRSDFAFDLRTKEPKRQGQKLASVVASKGCVARCTFCHRWDKGYRAFPVDKVINTIKHLRDKYNVGFVHMADENFGSDRRQVNAFIEAIKPLDVLYEVAGVRCRTVDPDLLRRLKESGCVSVFYGMETGSERILQVMEKNTSLEHNLNAVRWTAEAGLYTIYQLVLGMPGENEETIEETTQFFMKATEILPEPPLGRLSINFIQALPGTPVYEYARRKGLIGRSLLDEEAYLDLISDTNAGDETKFINFTNWDYLTVQSWRRQIIVACYANYMRKKGLPGPTFREMFDHYILSRLALATYEQRQAAEIAKAGREYEKGGYFNTHRSINYEVIGTHLFALRTPIIWAWILSKEFKRLGTRRFSVRLWEAVHRRIVGPQGDPLEDYRSLRKVVGDAADAPASPTEEAMAPFRAGR